MIISKCIHNFSKHEKRKKIIYFFLQSKNNIDTKSDEGCPIKENS